MMMMSQQNRVTRRNVCFSLSSVSSTVFVSSTNFATFSLSFSSTKTTLHTVLQPGFRRHTTDPGNIHFRYVVINSRSNLETKSPKKFLLYRLDCDELPIQCSHAATLPVAVRLCSLDFFRISFYANRNRFSFFFVFFSLVECYCVGASSRLNLEDCRLLSLRNAFSVDCCIE